MRTGFAILAGLARSRLAAPKRRPPSEPPTVDELAALLEYLDATTFRLAAEAIATASPATRWLDEIQTRLGISFAGQIACALLKAERDGRIVFDDR
jgi:hypothetical protein